MIVIDAKNQILGRIGVIAAKQALLGEEISIVNIEHAVISGSKKSVFSKYKRIHDMGVPRKGPYLPRMPDRFARRTIRGMLPMDKPRGREAYKKILCYIGMPKEFAGKETTKVAGADASKLKTLKSTTVGEICKLLGANWN